MAILLLGVVGFIFSSLMFLHQETVPVFLDASRAFYVAQGGVEYVGKYLKVSGGNNWSTLSPPPNQPISLGPGSFTVSFSNQQTHRLTATVIGSSGSAQRQMTVDFENTSGTALAVRSRGAVSMGNNAVLDCNPLDPSNPVCTNANLNTCPCVRQNVSAAEMPAITVPTPQPPTLPGGCTINANRTILAGTYYCPGGMTIGNNRVVTLNGPVTIFTTTFTLNNNAQFNASGAAADFLLMAQGNVFIANNAVFKGAVYAPGYNITVRNNAFVIGTLAGGNLSPPMIIDLDNNAQLDASAGSNAPYYQQAGGGAGTIRIATWQQ